MDITKTNWERILRDTGLNFLGVYKSGSKLILPMDNLITFKEKMRCIHKKLAKKTVAIVYDQEKIDDFFSEVSMDLYGKQVGKNEQISLPAASPAEVSRSVKDNCMEDVPPSADSGFVSNMSNSNSEWHNEDMNNSKDLFNGCKTVIPYGYRIRSSNVRLNAVVRELKTLSVDANPNATGVLLRVLFELSAKLYIENLTDADKTASDLKQVITFAANELQKRHKISNNEHSALSKDIDTLRALFNGYAHNTDSYPSSEAIKSVFKAHKNFIKQCLNN